MPALFSINRKTKSSLIVAMLSVFALGTSCSEKLEVEHFQQIQQTGQMSFDVSISDKWNIAKTRSAAQDGKTITSEKIENSNLWLITTVESNPDTTLFNSPKVETRATPYVKNDSRLTDFGVYAWTYTGNDWNNSDKKMYIDGDKVTQSGIVWSTDPSRFWPGDAYDMKFFAYAPYSTGLYTENEGTITINDFSVNTDVSQQQDLLATIPMADAKGNHNQTLALTFKHILTAIDVKASDPLKRRITSISFSGIATRGKFTLNGETPLWTPLESDVTEILCNVAEEDGVLDANEKYVISDENGTTFLMIPQKLDGATIHVTFDNGDKLSASLSGKEWPIGKRVTYIISDSGIKGIVKAENIEFSYEGGIRTFGVTSYVESGSIKLPVPWTAEFVREDGTAINPEDSDYPNWLSGLTQSGNGSIDVAENASVESQQQLLSNSYNTWLQGREIIGSDIAPHDLSKNEEGERYTANCYIVNNPGTYSFPLVYGNAIRKNNDDPSTYTSSSSIGNTYVLGRFINHAGDEITSPWIAAHTGCTPVRAGLVWQDAKNLIAPESIELRGNSAQEYYIVFSVAKETIQEGNAVIAVYGGPDGNTVLWSWHIWVTSYEQGLTPVTDMVYGPDGLQNDKKVISANDIEYIFMGPPLGWCYGGYYPERTARIRITQAGTKADTYIDVKQVSVSVGNNATYYQWGRKDPILPSNGEFGNKTYYTSDGTSSKDLPKESWGGKANNCIKTGIQRPQVFCMDENMDNRYYNLWSAKERVGEGAVYDTEIPDKSIYDPSPAGYEIPSNDAVSGFTYGGVDLMDNPEKGGYNDLTVNGYYTNECNSPYRLPSAVHRNKGWAFYCLPMTTLGEYNTSGGVIYFPGVSCRSAGLGDVSPWHGADFSLNWSAYSYVSTGQVITAHAIWFEYNQIMRHVHGQERGTACTVRPVKMRKSD